MRLILLGYYATFFPVKFPRISPSKHHTTPRRHICGRVFHHGENGAGTALCFILRRYAHPASPSPFCCSKGIAQILALNAQNRTLLQKTRFFCCKNYAVAASKTRSTPICSSVPDILPCAFIKKYQGHKGS